MPRPDYYLKWRVDATVYEHEDQLEADTMAWFKKFYNGDERLTQLYSKQKISEFTSRCHTNGISYERLLIIAKVYLIIAIFDDYYINKADTSVDKLFTMLHIVTKNHIVAIDYSDPDNFLYSAWSDVWQEISSLSPKQWQKQFASSLEYWLASVKIENKIRDSKRLLNYTEYHSIRLISVFMDVCCDFLEFAQNEYLTSEERANSTYQLLRIHAKTIVYLTNDLSWRKEKRSGDNLNIMYIHQELSKISEEEASAMIVKKINEELDAVHGILDNCRSLMPLGVDFYLPALTRFVRGNYDFHRHCHRFD